MKRHKGFWNRFRGVSDDVVNMIAILKLSIESAKETRDLYEKYISYIHDKKDYFDGTAPKKWIKYPGFIIYESIRPELPEHFPRYHEFKQATKKYGEEHCLKWVRENVYKCQQDLYNYIDVQIKDHPSYIGKIECLLDFEKNGYQWIYNEVVTGTVWERYHNYEYNVEIILSYIKMTEYITGKKLMDKYIRRFLDYD